jgi:hypothetical protein
MQLPCVATHDMSFVLCAVCVCAQERAPAPVLGLFGGGTRKVESFATQVERQVESQRTRKGTQVRNSEAVWCATLDGV